MFADLTDESFYEVLDIHLMGAVHCAQAALKSLPTDGTGRIINVVSSAGITGTLGQVNYSAAKASIIGFTKSLAREQARNNIMVNALAPLAATRMTETIRTNEKFAANMMNRIPLKRWAEPRRGGRRLRLLRLRRRLLHHRPGAAGGRRHGDVMPEHRGPLTGITVVALEQAVSAPMCTRVLADFGARVIKIENPKGGDFARYYDEVVNGPCRALRLGQSRQGVGDPRSENRSGPGYPAPAARSRRRAGVQPRARRGGPSRDRGRRYGAAPPERHRGRDRRLRPGGPLSHKRAYDLLVQAESGACAITGYPGMPAKPGPPIADISTGLYSALSILALLYSRDAQSTPAPHGNTVGLSLFDTMTELMGIR